MEDWMRNCETLIGEYDGEPYPLLALFAETEGNEPGSLLARLEDFLDEAAPGRALIDEVKDHLINGVLKTTVERIVDTWAPDTVSVQAQRSLRDFTSQMENKAQFMHRVFTEILKREEWTRLHRSVYEAVNDVLLAVIPVARQYPHNPSDFEETLLSFEIKPFLAQFCMAAWMGWGESFPAPALVTKVPTDLIVPTMRRLGMMDLLEAEWNVYGEWSEILSAMNKAGDKHVVFCEYSDKLLEERSVIWRKARNSICCRRMRTSGIRMMSETPPPPQCFQYFSKCSVTECCNLETPEKPHTIRCTRCYYHHFCSPACERYADAFNLHDCSFTPRDKVEAIKRETEAYLGWDKKSGSNIHENCNFCKTKRQNARGKKLLQCTRCKSVAYCDKSCQVWDFPEHKLSCKKK